MINITQDQIMQNWGVDNSDTPLVSVKCMTYNHEPYIAQALDGFLMQKTNFPFEVLVHDDASTDRTADIIREYETKFPKIVKVIYETENQYSKGWGLHHVKIDKLIKGKYIAFCEGDDYWIDENKLQMQVDFLEKNPEYTMCFHNASILDELDKGMEYQISSQDREYFSTELYEKWIVPTASIVCEKDILDFPIKNRTMFWAGDVIIIQSCCHMGRVYGFSKKMSVYRISSSGVSWNNSESTKKSINKLINHNKAIKLNFPLIRKKSINKKLGVLYLQAAKYYGTPFQRLLNIFRAFSVLGLSIFKILVDKFLET